MSVVTHDHPPSAGSRFTRSIARLTAPMTRPIAGRRFFPLWAVIHHRGRRSGRAYAVPVAVHVSDDAFTIPLPWGAETQWLRNVQASGGATIRWRGTDHATRTPQIVAFDDIPHAFRPAHRALMRASGVRTFVRLRRLGGAS